LSEDWNLMFDIIRRTWLLIILIVFFLLQIAFYVRNIMFKILFLSISLNCFGILIWQRCFWSFNFTAGQLCDPKGSASLTPDPYTGQCSCKVSWSDSQCFLNCNSFFKNVLITRFRRNLCIHKMKNKFCKNPP